MFGREKLKDAASCLNVLKCSAFSLFCFDLFHVSSCFLPLILALESGKKAVAVRFEVGHSRMNAPLPRAFLTPYTHQVANP